MEFNIEIFFRGLNLCLCAYVLCSCDRAAFVGRWFFRAPLLGAFVSAVLLVLQVISLLLCGQVAMVTLVALSEVLLEFNLAVHLILSVVALVLVWY